LSSTSERQAAFSRGVASYYTQLALAQQGYLHLGTTAQGAPLQLAPALLSRHLLIQSPTGGGKSQLFRAIFRRLATQRFALCCDDPKGDTEPELEEDCAALHLEDCVTVCDTSDPARLPIINPLKRNGIALEHQTELLLLALRQANMQESWDLTPQRPRWLWNSFLPVIEKPEGDGTFSDVLAMLDCTDDLVRQQLVVCTTNVLVRKEWLAYERQSLSRKREETASAYAWLRPFCLSPTLKYLYRPSPGSFEFGPFLRQAGIFLQRIVPHRPLGPDAANFMRSVNLRRSLPVRSTFPSANGRPWSSAWTRPNTCWPGSPPPVAWSKLFSMKAGAWASI
jgi:hypothetical protein